MSHCRRRFLHGAGAALPLPWLPSLLARPFARTDPAPPRRSVFLFFPNGVWEQGWVPEDEGPEYKLSPSLQPLAPIRSEVLVLTGLDKVNSKDYISHQSNTANFLTGLKVNRTTGKQLSAGGISIDQLIATKIGDQTPVKSLVLGVEPLNVGVDRANNITTLYTSLISWESAQQPVMPDNSPRAVFDRLFGRSPAATPAARRANSRLLNLVLEDARDLRTRLGRDDRVKLDEYLSSVESIESRIRLTERAATEGVPTPVDRLPVTPLRPADNLNFPDRLAAMLDLLVLAIQSDATRVASIMLANDVSNQTFGFIGVPESHHDVSHHQSDAHKINAYERITRWYVEQFAGFTQKLKAIPEGNGSLLDNCQLLFGSGMSDGNRHDPDNLPILLAGGAARKMPSGQHLSFRNGSTPLCNLYLSMLHWHGIDVDHFGDSTEPLL
jgi:hypothetical protein